MVRNGLFSHDNGGFDKFVGFGLSGDLVVSGTVNNHIVIGSNTVNRIKPIAPYKYKTNAGDINKWKCLSIHWDNYTTQTSNNSSVYCNGQMLTDFQSRSSVGRNNMTFDDINPSGIAPLKGDISFFAIYKGKEIEENDILLHHHVLCKWCNIDTVDFVF